MEDTPLLWVEARGWTPYRRTLALLFLIIGVGSTGTFFAENWGRAFGLAGAAFLFAVGWGIAAIIPVVGLASEVRRLGLSRGGVRIRQYGREMDVTWDSIQPEFLRPIVYGGLRVYYRPAGSKYARFALLTEAQTRALVRHPAAPKWIAPPDVRAMWGLSP